MRRSSPPFLFFVRASFVVGFTRFAFFLVDFLRQSSRRFFFFFVVLHLYKRNIFNYRARKKIRGLHSFLRFRGREKFF